MQWHHTCPTTDVTNRPAPNLNSGGDWRRSTWLNLLQSGNKGVWAPWRWRATDPGSRKRYTRRHVYMHAHRPKRHPHSWTMNCTSDGYKSRKGMVSPWCVVLLLICVNLLPKSICRNELSIIQLVRIFYDGTWHYSLYGRQHAHW
jgi:hypothetical protein